MKFKRLASQILLLAIFATLMILNKAQMWMALIFSSIVMAAFFGRFYCGWICPINTIIRIGNWIGKSLGTQKSYIPQCAKSKVTKGLIIVSFAIALAYTVFTIRLGRKFPLPVIIITLGVISTIFINERTWHRYLCPWGILFSFTARFTQRGMSINSSSCVSCSRCMKACPAEAVEMKKGVAVIDLQHCIMCQECSDRCPVKAIQYGKGVQCE